jgi:GNAT superfamily N-acetyltransferase
VIDGRSWEIRRLLAADLSAFQDGMPSWNSREYGQRLAYQDRGLAVQLVAWEGARPVGRAMLVLPGNPEWSTSAHREGCPEVRDVEVAEDSRRRGIATALVETLGDDAASAGFARLGLMVGLEESYGDASRLYERLGFRRVHGPFVVAARLEAEDGSALPVAGVCVFLVKDLSALAVNP